MRRKLVVGNWKMNGRRESNAALLRGLVESVPLGIDAAICVPFPYLEQAALALSDGAVRFGAQDVSERTDGAYTGDVSAGMLADCGCHFVIVGHSERRALHCEADAIVGAKAKAALAAGITPIVCVGESLEEREADRVDAVLLRQLGALRESLGQDELARVALAYEPVWAIGTGRSATPAQAQAVMALIRDWLAAQGVDAAASSILYGGSVKPASAEELFSLPDCDGGLIGGASLVAAEFVAICAAAVNASNRVLDSE